jgi:hypothetical protein
MKKTLNETAISNELREGSAFFRKPLERTTRPIKLEENNTQNHEAHASYEAYEAHEAYASRGAYVSQEARKLIRRPIQIYEDQFNRMRALCARSVLEEKPQLLRELFQEAVEDYLQKREPKNPKL